MLNQEQLAALLRQVLLLSCGGLIAKGYIDSGTVTIIASAVAALAVAGYGLYQKRKAALVASAAAQPGVVRIQVTDQKLADTLPSNVVGPTDKPGPAFTKSDLTSHA